MTKGSMVSTRQASLLVAFMWVAYFLNYSDRQAIFSMFPSLEVDLNMTNKQLGLAGAIFLWVYAFCCPIAGYLADRFSKRLLVILSLILWSLVTIATGFAGSALIILSLRAMMGVSEALFMPTAIALTADAHPPSLRSRAIAILTTAQIFGTVAGSWYGGWMADQGQWRNAFLVLGVVGLLYTIPYFLFLRNVEENKPVQVIKTTKIPGFRVLFKVKTFLLLCVVFPIFVFGLWLLYGWFPTFLHDKFFLNQSGAALNATIFIQGPTLIGLLGGGVIADAMYRYTKASRLWLLTASLILCAPFLHALGSSDTLTTTRIAAMGFGLFSGFMMGNIFPAAFDVVAVDTRASAVGFLNFFGAIMSGFATLFGGMWKESLGIDGLLSLTALAYMFAGIALIVGIKMLFPKDYKAEHAELEVLN
ncbi:MFS transporter [Cyclobacterium amurskyense]|uniref:MFS transporter n=1 Tax=Cyclobacterium amurskyense TaxID=320787 RepID=UPI0030DCA54E